MKGWRDKVILEGTGDVLTHEEVERLNWQYETARALNNLAKSHESLKEEIEKIKELLKGKKNES